MKTNTELLKVKSALSSLAFWLRNMKFAKRQNDIIEIERSDKTIKYLFNELDMLDVTFRTQNAIISEAQKENCDVDINDILKNIIIYFKDKDNTVIEGKELLRIRA